MPYAGRIIDGPLMGESHEYDYDDFMVLVPLMNPTTVTPPGPQDHTALRVKHVTYRWSRSLHAWCMEY